jgi:hypothetical protein
MAGLLGLLAPDPAVVPAPRAPVAAAPRPRVNLPAAEPIVAAPPVTTTPPAVLGVQYTRPAPRPVAPTSRPTVPPTTVAPPPTTSVAPATLPPCASQAKVNAAAPGRVKAGKVHISNNPNCVPHPPA